MFLPLYPQRKKISKFFSKRCQRTVLSRAGSDCSTRSEIPLICSIRTDSPVLQFSKKWWLISRERVGSTGIPLHLPSKAVSTLYRASSMRQWRAWLLWCISSLLRSCPKRSRWHWALGVGLFRRMSLPLGGLDTPPCSLSVRRIQCAGVCAKMYSVAGLAVKLCTLNVLGWFFLHVKQKKVQLWDFIGSCPQYIHAKEAYLSSEYMLNLVVVHFDLCKTAPYFSLC